MISGMNPVGETLHVISTIKVTVHNMALTSSEDLLLATVGKSTIQVIPSGKLGLMDSLYDVSPLLPTAVHVTHDLLLLAIRAGRENKGFLFPSNWKNFFSRPV
jgi:hypothetical protein